MDRDLSSISGEDQNTFIDDVKRLLIIYCVLNHVEIRDLALLFSRAEQVPIWFTVSLTWRMTTFKFDKV